MIGGTLIPLRFLLETMGYEVIRQAVPELWISGASPKMGIIWNRKAPHRDGDNEDRRPVSGDCVSHGVQEPMNAFFAERIKPAIEQGFRSDKANKAYEDFVLKTEVVLLPGGL